MSREQVNKQEQIGIFGEIAKGCITDHQKIEFFDSYKEAFFTDLDESKRSFNESITKDIDDAFYVYANMKKLNETELEELKRSAWSDFPEIFKIFLFDYCILNGDIYSKYFPD